jgi:predicted SAM-dependent methyltransferase
MNRRLGGFVRRSPTLSHAAKAAQASLVAVRQATWIQRRRSAIRRYLDGHEIKKLQLGTGTLPTPGWLNTDLDPTLGRTVTADGPPVIFLDVTRRFPFLDATFDYAAAEHLIEHLHYDAGRRMLAECARVLRPGGRIRIATPDLERLLNLYEQRHRLSSEQEAYIRWTADMWLEPDRASVAFVINNAFHAWGHQFLFDEDTLRATLAEVGFTAIDRFAVRESDDAHLQGLETHGCACGNEAMVAFETMVLEAERLAP